MQLKRKTREAGIGPTVFLPRFTGRRGIWVCLAFSGLAAGAAPARAATDTDNMIVTASVAASCIVDAIDLVFGAYNPVSGSPLPGATTANVTCTNGTAYVVSISAGAGTGATVASRKMTSGANLLNYSLYRDASHTQVWGVTNGVDTVAGTGAGVLQPLNVYGLIPASQAVPVGSYTDTVVVTVTY